MGASRHPLRTRASAALAACAIALLSGTTRADDGPTVAIPLDVYQELMGERGGASAPGHAFGRGQVTVAVEDGADGAAGLARVTVQVPVRVLEARPTPVPLLPLGTAVTEATAGGTPIELSPTAAGLAWVHDQAGTHAVRLVYEVPVAGTGRGRTLALPLPAASVALSATLPGVDLDASVLPGQRATIAETGGQTRITATLAPRAGVQLAWRVAGPGEGFTVSRAQYDARLVGDTLAVRAVLGVELSTAGPARVPLVPSSLAVERVQVDRADVPLSVLDERIAATIRGRGRHRVELTFEVPVADEGGLPGVSLQIPEVPVSRFEITLPGDKNVQVTPASGVETASARGQTVARFVVPMTGRVGLTWSEAVPEGPAEEVEARARAEVVHIAHAEEGVLHVRAVAELHVSRGAMSQVRFAMPSDVLVHEVSAAGVTVSDWRMGEEQELLVFLDRAVADATTLTVRYERALGDADATGASAEPLPVPLLSVRQVHRQRGMVALLSGRHLTLDPTRDEGALRVGENQLPARLRASIDATVAHTYRYLEEPPVLEVRVSERERERPRFDAQVDTLVSLGDVTLTAEASVALNVKGGSLTELTLELPEGVSLLGLAAPSLREHSVRTEGAHQLVDVALTQEVEGQLRVEVSYERITPEGEGELGVPLVHVRGADVEQGRVALEALAALQVEATRRSHLSPLEAGELPEALVARTTKPILMAFRYARATQDPALGLRVTRHREVELADATIDEADYHTLVTADGGRGHHRALPGAQPPKAVPPRRAPRGVGGVVGERLRSARDAGAGERRGGRAHGPHQRHPLDDAREHPGKLVDRLARVLAADENRLGGEQYTERAQPVGTHGVAA